MIAVIELVKAQRPHEVIVAVPVAPRERLDDIRRRCDQVICLLVPRSFWAVGEFYANFEPVEDAQVVDILRQFAPATQKAAPE